MEAPRYYSRQSSTTVSEGGHLPHWSQRCATFVTFRLADSLPAGKLEAFQAERAEWLSRHQEPWSDETREEYLEMFPRRFQKWLDSGHGSCVLGSDPVRQLVEDVLRHFDGIRYSLYAFVVMPNHVHVLFMPRDGFDGLDVVRGWKGYSARIVNQKLGRRGSLWQKESYDHLVRDVGSFNRIRSYIKANDRSKAFDAYEVSERDEA